MQKFIRQTGLVFRFFYFTIFWGNKSVCNTSEAWHDNSDIVWRKKISLHKKNNVLKLLMLIVCWAENSRPILVPPRNDVWLTRVEISYQQRMTNEVSLLRVLLIGWNKFHFWNYEYMKIIYVNCRVKNYLKEDHRSCIRNLCICEKKAWKKIQACTGFEPLTSAIPVGSALPIKLTTQLGAGRWIGS